MFDLNIPMDDATFQYNLQSMCEESDIKEMGIPMGPRKKLQSFIKLHKTRKVRKIHSIFDFLNKIIF